MVKDIAGTLIVVLSFNMQIAFFTSLLLPIGLVFLVNDITMMNLFIYIGIGHVAIAFLYMFRSPKVSKQFKFSIIPVALLCYGVAGVVYGLNIDYVLVYILLSFMIFCAHYYWDEVRLVYGNFPTHAWYGLVSIITAFAFLYVHTYQISFLFSERAVLQSLLVFGVVFFFLFLIYSVRNNYFSHRHLLFFTAGSFIAPFLLALLKNPVSFLYVAGVVIIFHYIRWYIYYYFRTKEYSIQKFKEYTIIFTAINVTATILFVFYLFNPQQPILQFMFHPIYFYALANVHVIASFMKG